MRGPDSGRSELNSSVLELESLGLKPSKLNEFNDVNEIQSLVNNLKQMYYEDYKTSSIFTD